MAKAKPTSRKKSGFDENRIIAEFINQTLEEGKRPASIYKFCKELDLKEDDFYAKFGSFDALESKIWERFMTETIDTLHGDSSYVGFSVREKVLAFYYTFIEVIRKERSFLLFESAEWKKLTMPPRYIARLRPAFDDWIRTLVEEGIESGEIAKRPYLERRYPEVLWYHFLFVVHFWLNDDSPGMEQTDAAIEKSVNLAFEVIGQGVLEQSVDFGKFLYQNMKY